jgi:ABC-type lipoprotein release transport system permease subunit
MGRRRGTPHPDGGTTAGLAGDRGIARNVRQRNLEEDSRPVFYRPYEQGLDLGVSLAIRVRSTTETPRVAEALRKSVREADPQQVWDAVECMRQIIYDSESLSLRRPIVRLLGAFASIALILAGAGLFAVLAHSIAERKREIGIRMAVGARQTQVLRQIATDTLRLTLPGALIGAGLAYTLSALLPSGHIGWSGSGVFVWGRQIGCRDLLRCLSRTVSHFDRRYHHSGAARDLPRLAGETVDEHSSLTDVGACASRTLSAKALSCSPAALDLFMWFSYRCFTTPGKKRFYLR